MKHTVWMAIQRQDRACYIAGHRAESRPHGTGEPKKPCSAGPGTQTANTRGPPVRKKHDTPKLPPATPPVRPSCDPSGLAPTDTPAESTGSRRSPTAIRMDRLRIAEPPDPEIQDHIIQRRVQILPVDKFQDLPQWPPRRQDAEPLIQPQTLGTDGVQPQPQPRKGDRRDNHSAAQQPRPSGIRQSLIPYSSFQIARMYDSNRTITIHPTPPIIDSAGAVSNTKPNRPPDRHPKNAGLDVDRNESGAIMISELR